MQVELLQDEEVSAEHGPGHGHVTNSLTQERHGGAAAVQTRQAEPGAQGLICKTQHRVNTSQLQCTAKFIHKCFIEKDLLNVAGRGAEVER